jgi:hypothetical protein
LRSNGDTVLDTTVLNIDEKHKASVHDPHRVIAGAVTPMLTWGIFGLVTGGVASLIVSAVLGAALGGFYAYHSVHHATGAQLTRLGTELPASSSALLTFVETTDAQRLVEPATHPQPSIASVVLIGDDLTPRGFAPSEDAATPARPGPSGQSPRLEQPSRLSMILLRYPGYATAKSVAAQLGELQDTPEVELVVATDRSGRTRTTDPKFGSEALGKNNIVGWGGLGLVCGALAGLTGGGGVIGFLAGGIITAVVWALFGLGAGALYGLWAGRVISARRLKPVRGLLAEDTSSLVAWTDHPLSEKATQTIAAAKPQQLTVSFTPTAGGAVLKAS